MKLVFLFGLCLACNLSGWARLSAQNASAAAAALAAAKSAEEGYQRLNALIEQMTENYALQQKKISAMAEEINRLRDENTRENSRQSASLSGLATKDDLRKLAEKVQE